MKRYAEAETFLRMVLEKENDHYLAWFNLGYILLRTGSFIESIKASKYAMNLKPDLSEAAINYSIAELCVGNPLQALYTVEYTLKNNPHSVSGQLVRAVAYLYLSQGESCLETLTVLHQQRIHFTDFINDLIKTLCRAEKNKFAEQLLKIVIVEGYGNKESLELYKMLESC
jgi:tetratricopeptide (TPR) repeat protein